MDVTTTGTEPNDHAVVDIEPGRPDSPVVLHVPHSSRDIPADVRTHILLNDDALDVELDAMTDAFTDVVARRTADLVEQITGRRPWVVVNRTSRLVVDPERFPDDREEMASVGMGAVYTRTSDGQPLRDPDLHDSAALLDRFYWPYAHAVASAGLPTARDTPFAGCYVPLDRFGVDRELSALMVEIRRDVIGSGTTMLPGGVDRVAQALATTLATVSPSSSRLDA